MIVYFPKPHPISPSGRTYTKPGVDKLYKRQRGQERVVKGVPVRQSIYYWWYEFLKLSWKYRKACGQHVKLNARQEQIYQQWWDSVGHTLHADFGDIYRESFWQWWSNRDDGRTRGLWLFGILVSDGFMDSFADWGTLEKNREAIESGELRVILVPKSSAKRVVATKLASLMKTISSAAAPPQVARYHPHSLKVQVDTLESAWLAYTAKQKGCTNIEIAGQLTLTAKAIKELEQDARKRNRNSYEAEALAKLVQTMSVEQYDKMIDSGKDKFAFLSKGKERTQTKNYLNLKASRLLRMAKANIEGAEQGKFPISISESSRAS